MAYKYLVIVESPAKAKTIEKYLGRNYKVVASVGHIRDLPKVKWGLILKIIMNLIIFRFAEKAMSSKFKSGCKKLKSLSRSRSGPRR